MKKRHWLLVVGALALVGCGGAALRGTTTPEKTTAPLGSMKNPVRCHFPPGEQEYLRRLRCPDGEAPVFRRVGSYGMGPDGHIMDGYRVQCAGAKPSMVFMDMYHRGTLELDPVPGFKIDNAP